MHGKLLTLHRHVGYMSILPPLSHEEILRDMSTSGGKQVDGTVKSYRYVPDTCNGRAANFSVTSRE